MSENIFDENYSFFGNVDIPNTTKLGTMALLLGGTYSIYTNKYGKKTFCSTVVVKDGDAQKSKVIMFDINDHESLGQNAIAGYSEALGIKNFSDMCSGKISEASIVDELKNKFRANLDLNEQGVSGRATSISSNIESFLKNDIKTINSEIADKLINNVDKIYSGNEIDKKKQLTEA